MFFVLAILFFIYFLPTGIALQRNHKDSTGIFLLNIFVGWTFVGWVVALVWAVKSGTSKEGNLN